MKNNIKPLKEQQTTGTDTKKEKSILTVVFESYKNCIPSWLKNPIMSTHENKPVIMGQNSKNEDVILFVDLQDPEKKNMLNVHLQKKKCTFSNNRAQQ
jgi:hypothetical protein